MSIQKYREKLTRGQLLGEKEINNLADTVISILIQEPNVLEIKGTLYIIGDIHGQFYDCLKMLNQIIPSGSTCLFLGDYVDRGYHSIETICYLLCLKCLHPTEINMIRGNHQTSSLTRIYGFYDEVIKKYGNYNVWKKITDVFTYLPLSAVANQSFFCVHGGLSPTLPLVDNITQIDRIRQIPESGSMSDLVWSDPENSEKVGWSVNNRGAGFIFSKEIVKQFLLLNGLSTIVRAHQLVESGYIYNFGDKSFVTVWSAPNYCYRCGNEASVMKVDEVETSFINFDSSEETSRKKIHYENILPYFL